MKSCFVYFYSILKIFGNIVIFEQMLHRAIATIVKRPMLSRAFVRKLENVVWIMFRPSPGKLSSRTFALLVLMAIYIMVNQKEASVPSNSCIALFTK